MENDHAVKIKATKVSKVISITIRDHDNGTDHTYQVNDNTTLRFLKKRFCEINGMKMEDICTWVDSYNTNSSIRLEDDDMTLEEYRLYNLSTNHVFVVNIATDWPENIKAKKFFTIRITDNMTGETNSYNVNENTTLMYLKEMFCANKKGNKFEEICAWIGPPDNSGYTLENNYCTLKQYNLAINDLIINMAACYPI
jgi:hypothetical protein